MIERLTTKRAHTIVALFQPIPWVAILSISLMKGLVPRVQSVKDTKELREAVEEVQPERVKSVLPPLT